MDQAENDLHSNAQKNLLAELIDMTEDEESKGKNNIILRFKKL